MSFTPKILTQRDPLWANEKLGFDDSVTIGTDGCTLVCLTMLVNGYGFNETPSSMNRKLKDMGSGIGFLGGLIVWPGLTRAFPGIVFNHIIVCRDAPAPLDEINTSLAAGQPLVVEIDESPSAGLQNHWVVLVARQGSDYLMLDPWPNPPDQAPKTLGSRYGFGRPPSQYITAVAWYEAGAKPAPQPVPVPEPAPNLYVRVQTSATAGLRLRYAPTTSVNAIATEAPGTLLHCLEPEAVAQIQDRRGQPVAAGARPGRAGGLRGGLVRGARRKPRADPPCSNPAARANSGPRTRPCARACSNPAACTGASSRSRPCAHGHERARLAEHRGGRAAPA